PDRARAAHRELAVRGRLAHGDLLDEITALEAREVAGEVRIVEEGEPIESEPVECRAESTFTKWRGVDGGVRPSEPVRVQDSLRVVVAKLRFGIEVREPHRLGRGRRREPVRQ